jgi:hypothetical protein
MKKKAEIKKMENLIIENFAKVYNRIKPINENVVNEFGTLGHYIAKALSVEPTEDRDGLYYNVVDNNAGDDYTLIFDFEVIHEKGERLYGKRRMYFIEDSIFGKPNEELAELAKDQIAMEFEGNFKYKKYKTSWSLDSYDITNDLSEDTNQNAGINDANIFLYPIDGYGSPELIRQLKDIEQPDGIIVHFGGQTPLKLANSIHKFGGKIIGTTAEVIDLAEDIKKGKRTQLKLSCPFSDI